MTDLDRTSDHTHAMNPGARRRSETASTKRWLPGALMALAVGIAVIALLGPFAADVINYRVPPLLRHQLIGADAVSLFILAPLALLAASLIRRRKPIGPFVALAPALTTCYLLVEVILAPDRGGRPGNDEVFFPLFLTVFILAVSVSIAAWRVASPRTVRLDDRTRLLVAGLLSLLVGLFVLVRYLPSWLDIVQGTALSAEYVAAPGLWWIIALEDLGLLFPAAVVASFGLFRGAKWAPKLTLAVSSVLALTGVAVAGMAWSMALYGDPDATPGTALMMTVLALFAASPAIFCWTAELHHQRRGS